MFLKACKTSHSCSCSSGRGCSCWCASLPWSTACTTPWSTILLRFLIFLYNHRSEYLVWHSQNQTLFRPMGAQITFIIFPPMRWELSKLNKSSYPQSRILSPFKELLTELTFYSYWKYRKYTKYNKITITVQNPYLGRQGGRWELCFSPGEGRWEVGG